MNTTRITMFAFTVTLAAMLLHAGSTNCPSQSGVGRSAYVPAHEWQRQHAATSQPIRSASADHRQSDWHPLRNSVRLTNLMSHASLIVEARVIGCAACKHSTTSSVNDLTFLGCDDLIKVRVERILASRWSEDETRERLVHGGNASFLYVAVRTPCDDGALNDPCLFDNHRYVLWLTPHAVPDVQFEIIQSYAQEPILRSAVYKACIGHKGALLLDEPDGLAMHSLMLSSTVSEDEWAYKTRRIAESQREYLVNSFNTTNKNDIVQAVRHLARAMAPGSDKRAHLQRAKQYLNGAAHLSLDGLIEMERFRWTDVAVPEH